VSSRDGFADRVPDGTSAGVIFLLIARVAPAAKPAVLQPGSPSELPSLAVCCRVARSSDTDHGSRDIAIITTG
jgi:hypothetical protein